jgi:hypothetical protein
MMGCTWNRRKALRKIVTGKGTLFTVTDFSMLRTGKMKVTAASADVHF